MSDWAAAERVLRAGVAELDVDAAFVEPAMAYLKELQRWNRRQNLTSVREPVAMVTRHLLDSLTARPFVGESRLADVGSGAGLPGIPLALASPALEVTVIESHQRKASFLGHIQRELQLANLSVAAQRAETLAPSRPFDTVVSRAVASLAELIELCVPLCADSGRLLAMKGRRPDAEIEALPAGWRAVIHPVRVPGLDEQRHIIELVRE